MNRKTLDYLDDILGESKGFTSTDNFNVNTEFNEACGAINEMGLDDLKRVKKQVDSLIERKEHKVKENQQNTGFNEEQF